MATIATCSQFEHIIQIGIFTEYLSHVRLQNMLLLSKSILHSIIKMLFIKVTTNPTKKCINALLLCCFHIPEQYIIDDYRLINITFSKIGEALLIYSSRLRFTYTTTMGDTATMGDRNFNAIIMKLFKIFSQVKIHSNDSIIQFITTPYNIYLDGELCDFHSHMVGILGRKLYDLYPNYYSQSSLYVFLMHLNIYAVDCENMVFISMITSDNNSLIGELNNKMIKILTFPNLLNLTNYRQFHMWRFYLSREKIFNENAMMLSVEDITRSIHLLQSKFNKSITNDSITIQKYYRYIITNSILLKLLINKMTSLSIQAGDTYQKIYELLDIHPRLSASILLLAPNILASIKFIKYVFIKFIDGVHYRISMYNTAETEFNKSAMVYAKSIVVYLFKNNPEIFTEVLMDESVKNKFRQCNLFHLFYGRYFNQLFPANYRPPISDQFYILDFIGLLKHIGGEPTSEEFSRALTYILNVWKVMSESVVFKRRYAVEIYSWIATHNRFYLFSSGGAFESEFQTIMRLSMLPHFTHSQRSIFNMLHGLLTNIKMPINIKNIVRSISNMGILTGGAFKVHILLTQLKNLYKECVKDNTSLNLVEGDASIQLAQEYINFLKLFRPNLLESKIISKKEYIKLTKIGILG